MGKQPSDIEVNQQKQNAMNEKELEELEFKKRYILNRLKNVFDEVSIPGYAALECLTILTAAVLIDTGKKLTLEDQYESVDYYAKILKVLIKKMLEKEDVSMAELVETVNKVK